MRELIAATFELMIRHAITHFRAAAVLLLPLWDDRTRLQLFQVAAKSPDDLMFINDKYRELRKDYHPPKYPIVLCHGLSGFDTLTLFQAPQIQAMVGAEDFNSNLQKVSEQLDVGLMVNYWHGIKDALVKCGATVITARVPPFGTIAERAALLDKLLREKVTELSANGERVKLNLVGHSMGGLDCRYLISQIQTADSPYEIVSLTTVSTPHHGSEVADFVMGLIGKDSYLKAICPKAIPQLTTSFMRQFNDRVRDDPNVAYFSYGALMNPLGIKLFRATYEILKHGITKNGGSHTENDGMVSILLSKWGQYIGTLNDVDHLDLINWTNTIKASVDKLMFQLPPSFNPIALYLDIADTLSQKGF